MIDKLGQFLEWCRDEGEHPATKALLGRIERELVELDTTDNDESSCDHTIDEVVKDTRELAEATGKKLQGLSTGFGRLDERLLGLNESKLIIIGARPSVGKTSLALNIAMNVVKADHPVLVFSLEMTNKDLVKRALSSDSGVNLRKLASREVDVHDERMAAYEMFARAGQALKGKPLYMIDREGLDIDTIRAIARRQRKQHGIELIVIDYLQLCRCHEAARLNSRQLEVAAISAQAKSMAKELKVPVILLSQLSRDSEKTGGRPRKPWLSDLRDSGSIEQDADVVMLLHRPSMYKNVLGNTDPDRNDETLAIVDVAKNRDGERGEVRIKYEAEFTRFLDVPR